MKHINKEIIEFLEGIRDKELAYIYSLDKDDSEFGVETDRLTWCKKVLHQEVSVRDMISYFEINYSKDEKQLVLKLKELNYQQLDHFIDSADKRKELISEALNNPSTEGYNRKFTILKDCSPKGLDSNLRGVTNAVIQGNTPMSPQAQMLMNRFMRFGTQEFDPTNKDMFRINAYIIAHEAADWWVNLISNPVHDSKPDNEAGSTAQAFMNENVVSLTDIQKESLHKNIADYIIEYFKKSDSKLQLKCDYEPWKPLSDICRRSDIPESNIPIKTSMHIYIDHIIASTCNSNLEEIYRI